MNGHDSTALSLEAELGVIVQSDIDHDEFYIPFKTNGRKYLVSPWLAGFDGISLETARQKLEREWARIESPVLKTLANRLLQSERLGVANVEPGFVFGQYGNRDSESVGERWFLPTQMPLAEVKQKMYKLQLHKDSLFVEFFTWFSGLQYDLDFICGFSDLRSVQVFDDEIALGCDFSEPYQEWIGSPVIFHGLDGSVILARTDGSVGFWQVGETAISKSKSTFRDVVFQFANLLGTTSPCVDLDPWLR